MRKFMLVSLAAVAVSGATLYKVFPTETPVQKADRAFCNELLKSFEARAGCREVTGISKNVKLVDGRIVQVGQALAWHDVNRTLKGDREYDEGPGDRADAQQASFSTRYAGLEK